MARKVEGEVKQAELKDSKDQSDLLNGLVIDDKIKVDQIAVIFRSVCVLLGICDKDGIVK